MNKGLRISIITLLSLLVIFMASGFIRRYNWEKYNSNVEICVELTQLNKVCMNSKYPVANLLDWIHTIGVSSVVIDEDTFEGLQQQNRLFYFSADEIYKYRFLDLISAQSMVLPETIIIPNLKYAQNVVSLIKEKTGYEIKYSKVGNYIVFSISNAQFIKNIGFGFLEDNIGLVKKAGMQVILRPDSSRENIYNNISWLFNQLPDNLSGIILPNISDNLDNKVTSMISASEPGIKIPLFELTQNNINTGDLRRITPNIVRAHRIKEINNQTQSGEKTMFYGVRLKEKEEMLVSRWLRAVRERNCRILYFDFAEQYSYRPGSNSSLENIENNLDVLRELCSSLKKSGYTLAPVVLSRENMPWMLLNKSLTILISALIALLCPVISLWYFLRINKSPVVCFCLITMVNISAGIMVNILCFDYGYLAGLDDFPGIKMLLVMPFIMVMPFLKGWVKKKQDSSFIETLKNAWSEPVCGKHMALGILFFAMFLILIVRSGNNPSIFQPQSQELGLRLWLENMFYIRPRFKEMFIGHPAMLLGLVYNMPALVFIGLIGQVSIINTFLHLHTPLPVSLVRSVTGSISGALIGIVIIYTIRKISVYKVFYTKPVLKQAEELFTGRVFKNIKNILNKRYCKK